MTIIRRAGSTVALLLVTVSIAACGGGAASNAPDQSSAPSATAGSPAPVESTTPTGSAAPGESAAPSVDPLPSFDLSGAVANLDGVDSYHVEIVSGGAPLMSSTVVTRPVLSRDVTMNDGSRVIVIGEEAWVGQAGEDPQPIPAQMVSAMLSAFDPSFLVAAFNQPGTLSGATEQGTEDKNGVPTRHFRVTADSAVGKAAEMPAGSSVDLWIHTELGILISMDVQGIEDGFTLDVTKVNDPQNEVERPS